MKASGGSDKAIRIWDTSSNSSNINTNIELQALASVSRVKWRPNYPTQIASTCVEVDYAISLWDIHSPHVPTRIFRGHIDAVPDITWLPPLESNDKESYLLACSRDETVGLHGFAKAHNPSENAARNSISISPKHDIAIVANEKHILSTSLLNFDMNTKQLEQKRFQYLAKHYKSKVDNNPGSTLKTFTDICENNRKACLAVNLPTVAQSWAVVGVLLREREGDAESKHLISNNNGKNSIASNSRSVTDDNVRRSGNVDGGGNNNINNKNMGNIYNNNKKRKTIKKHTNNGNSITEEAHRGNKNNLRQSNTLGRNQYRDNNVNNKIKLSNKNFSFGITSTENDTTDDDRLYVDEDDDDDGSSSMSLLLQAPTNRSHNIYGGSNSNAPESTIADFQDAKSATDNSFIGSDYDDESNEEDDTGDTFSMLIQQLDRANPTGAAASYIDNGYPNYANSNIGHGGSTNSTPENTHKQNNKKMGNSISNYRGRTKATFTTSGSTTYAKNTQRQRHFHRHEQRELLNSENFTDDEFQESKFIGSDDYIDDDDSESFIGDGEENRYGYHDTNGHKKKAKSSNALRKQSRKSHPTNTMGVTDAIFTLNDRTGTTTMRKDIILSLLDYYSNVNSDLQFCATLADLSINAGIDINRQQAATWFHAYIEALHKHNLAIIATEFVQNMQGSVGQLNQASTTIYSYCNNCARPLQPSLNSICDKCNGRNLARCTICEQRVRGQYMWCQRCGHGGHLNCITGWFNNNSHCPSGCGCKCWS